VPQYRQELAGTHTAIGAMFATQGKTEMAREHLQKARDCFANWSSSTPNWWSPRTC